MSRTKRLALAQSPDGVFFLVGATGNLGLFRIDSGNGNKLSETSFGGEVQSIRGTSDGGFIAAGFEGRPENGRVVKLDAAGEVRGGDNYSLRRNTEDSRLYDIREVKDGGYFAGGRFHRSMWLLRLSADFTQLWSKTLNDTQISRITPLEEGGFLLGGLKDSGAQFGRVVRVDASGTPLSNWDIVLPVKGQVWGLEKVADGGFLVAGHAISGPRTEPTFGGTDGWLVHLDASGKQVWDMSLGGSSNDSIRDLQPTSDGGYILGGTSSSAPSRRKQSSNYGDDDYWIVKLAPPRQVSAPTITSQPQSQTVASGAAVTFNVSAAGTLPLNYQWRKDGTELLGRTNSTLTLASVSASEAGNYTVTVSNAAGSVTSTTATLTVNMPPVITSQPQSQTVNAGENVTFSVSAGGSGPLAYHWKKDGTDLPGQTNSILTLPNVNTNHAGSYTVTVSNTAETVTSASASLTVTPPPQRGLPTISPIPHQVTRKNIDTEPIPFSVSDAETSAVNLTVTVSSDNPVLFPGQSNFQIAPPSGPERVMIIRPAAGQSGVAKITVTVMDSDNNKASTTFELTVLGDPPTISAISNQTIRRGGTTGAIAFSIGDAETILPLLRLSVDASNQALVPNSGIELGGNQSSANRTVTVTPLPDQVGTTIITITVTDNDGDKATAKFEVSVEPDQPSVVNTPPTLLRTNDRTVDERILLAIQIKATDSDLPPQQLAFSLEPDNPAGAAINPTTGEFTWTPTELQGPSTNLVTVIVTDSGVPALTATNRFTVIVNEVNSAPVISAIADKIVEENSRLEFAIEATDPDVPKNAITFALGSDAPDGASIDPKTGVFIWTVPAVATVQTNRISVRVIDDGSPPMEATATIQVIVTPAKLRLAQISDRTEDEGTVIAFVAVVMDSPLAQPPFAYALEPGAPEGALISPNGGAFLWQPTEAQGPSTNTITVRVTDSSNPPLAASRRFTVIVREVNRPPVLEAISPQRVTVGQPLKLTVKAQDLDLPANELTYSLEPGGPTGASIDAKTGLFSWTPEPLAAGSTNSITVKVSDNGSPPLSHTATFAVSIAAPEGPKLVGAFLPNGQFQLTLDGEIGRIYLIQASADLAVWEPVTNILSTATTMRITDGAAASFRQRFYRALSP